MSNSMIYEGITDDEPPYWRWRDNNRGDAYKSRVKSERLMRAIAILDAAADEKGRADVEGVGYRIRAYGGGGGYQISERWENGNWKNSE